MNYYQAICLRIAWICLGQAGYNHMVYMLNPYDENRVDVVVFAKDESALKRHMSKVEEV